MKKHKHFKEEPMKKAPIEQTETVTEKPINTLPVRPPLRSDSLSTLQQEYHEVVEWAWQWLDPPCLLPQFLRQQLPLEPFSPTAQ